MKEVIWDEGIKSLEGPPHLAWAARNGILGKGHSLSKGMLPRNRGKHGLQRQKHNNRRTEDMLDMEVGPDHRG